MHNPAEERAKAQSMRKSGWWQDQIQNGVCYYCDASVDKSSATMDHVVPISQGGKSTKGNIVVCCKSCNTEKKSMTAVEWLLAKSSLH